MYSHAKVALDVSPGLPHSGYPNILVEDSFVADTAGYPFPVKVLQESLSVLPTGLKPISYSSQGCFTMGRCG